MIAFLVGNTAEKQTALLTTTAMVSSVDPVKSKKSLDRAMILAIGIGTFVSHALWQTANKRLVGIL